LNTDNVVYISAFARSKPQQNIVYELLTSVVQDYNGRLSSYNINVEDPTIAFDVATIQYLLHGMAHRSQGEEHPSQIILNKLRVNMLGF
jgi:replication fork clamp-binding protein CrfC